MPTHKVRRPPRPLWQELLLTLVVALFAWVVLTWLEMRTGSTWDHAWRTSTGVVVIAASSWIVAGFVFDRLLPNLVRRR